uniref:Uncharacterized protein n=1 Tax=Rhizophora mucronata TaxID=61149 RepID=A0A2P2N7X1_RHIMU
MYINLKAPKYTSLLVHFNSIKSQAVCSNTS